MMEHLKITLKVVKMVIPSLHIHLDDILAAAAVKQYVDQGNGEIEDYDDIINFLPLEKLVVGEDSIWKASVFRWVSFGKYMKSVTQSLDQYSIAELKDNGVLKTGMSSLNTMSGPLKSSIDLIPSVAYSIGIAHCVGNKVKIEKLLAVLDNIGKKHQRGSGNILYFSVEVLDENNDWTDRSLPLSMKEFKQEDHALASNVGISPPYWLKKNIRQAGWRIK
jgi:CRISPR type IV-associated protein Csf3